MKKIGILGGTFDPPHYGHLIIADEVLDKMKLDAIWFMPNQEPPHKVKNNRVTAKDRVIMLELAVNDHPNFFVEKIELERPGPSYTFETMQELQRKHDNKQFYFIIGADMVEYLPKWHRIEELLKIVTFVGVNRPGHQLKSPYPVQFADVPQIEISSSLIRERVRDGATYKYLVPEPVRQYMERRNLYGS